MFRKEEGICRISVIGRMWTLRIVDFDINTLQGNNFSDTFTCQAQRERSLYPVRGKTLHEADTRNLSRDRLFVFFTSGRRRVPHTTPSGHQSLVDSRTTLRRLAYPALTVLKATRGKEARPSRSRVSSSIQKAH